MSTTFQSFDEFAQEADGAPYEIPVTKEETIIIKYPDGNALIHIMQGLRDSDILMILSSLTGDQWPRVEELFGSIGHTALPKLTEKMMDHFDLYEPVTLVGPGGGKVTRKRPTDIQALVNQGYRPMGEARAS